MAEKARNLILIVDDMLEYERLLARRLRELLSADEWVVTALPHSQALRVPPPPQGPTIHTAFIDAHDLGRERDWRKKIRAGVPALPTLSGGEVACRLLGMTPPPRVIVYSTEIDDPTWNLTLREATDWRASAYYDSEGLLQNLRSALFDEAPDGQFPPPSREELAALGLAEEARPLAFAADLSNRPDEFRLLAGVGEMWNAARGLGDSSRKVIQRLSAKYKIAGRDWREIIETERRALGFPRDKIAVRRPRRSTAPSDSVAQRPEDQDKSPAPDA